MLFERSGFVLESACGNVTSSSGVVESSHAPDESTRDRHPGPQSLLALQRARGLLGGTGRGVSGGIDRPSERLRVPLQPPDLLACVAWLVVASANPEDVPPEQGWLLNLRPFLWSKGEVTVGREVADIKFTNQALSKSHLAIAMDDLGTGFLVRDLGSTNGSFLAQNLASESVPITSQVALRDGNSLRMGDVILVFRCYRRPGNT